MANIIRGVNLLLGFCSLLVATSLYANQNNDFVKLGGSIRERFEYKQDFNYMNSNQNYWLTQLRANADFKIGEYWHAFIEFQHADIYGERLTEAPSISSAARPNIYEDDFDIHQAYVHYKDACFQFKAGRQKFNLGDQRLVASLEWVNTARVFDGVRLTFGSSETHTVDVFASKHVTVDPHHMNDWESIGNRYADSNFYGVNFVSKTLSPGNEMRAYWYIRHNDMFHDTVHTVGAHFLTNVDSIDVYAQGALQFGEYSNNSHLAYMINVGASIPVDDYLKGYKVALVYNHASGDNTSGVGSHHTFDNLYPLNHAYYGYMDLFALQNIHNLQLTIKGPFFCDGEVYVGVESFWLAKRYDAWYNAGLGVIRTAVPGSAPSKHVGEEVDITFNYAFFNKKLKIYAGYGHLFTGRYIRDTGSSKDPNFYFFQGKYVV